MIGERQIDAIVGATLARAPHVRQRALDVQMTRYFRQLSSLRPEMPLGLVAQDVAAARTLVRRGLRQAASVGE